MSTGNRDLAIIAVQSHTITLSLSSLTSSTYFIHSPTLPTHLCPPIICVHFWKWFLITSKGGCSQQQSCPVCQVPGTQGTRQLRPIAVPHSIRHPHGPAVPEHIYQYKQERAPSWPFNAKECVATKRNLALMLPGSRSVQLGTFPPLEVGFCLHRASSPPKPPVSCVSHYNTPRELREKKARWRQNTQSVLAPN